MIDLSYGLVIEATDDPSVFGFYSPELEGFTGVGHSIEDCLYQAKWGIAEHIALLKEHNLPVPPANPNPRVCNRKLAQAGRRIVRRNDTELRPLSWNSFPPLVRLELDTDVFDFRILSVFVDLAGVHSPALNSFPYPILPFIVFQADEK